MSRRLTGACLALGLVFGLAACDSSHEPGEITVTARIVHDDPFGEEATFSIEVKPVGLRLTDSTGEWAEAEFQITWAGDLLIRLDDVRFDSELDGSRSGTLVTAGRACVPQWFREGDEIKVICLRRPTTDLPRTG